MAVISHLFDPADVDNNSVEEEEEQLCLPLNPPNNMPTMPVDFTA